MVEQVVEVIDGLAFGITWLKREGLVVGIVEGLWEPPEQFGHGEVGFPRAEISGRIEDAGYLTGPSEIVSRPQVAVEQGRCFVCKAQ